MTSRARARIDNIDIEWPLENKKLEKIFLNGETIFDHNINPPSTLIDTFKGGTKKRIIRSGETATLTFEFEKHASITPSDYKIYIHFAN